MSTIYKITITDFEDHNPKYSKSFKYAMISHNFCDHSSVRSLPLSVSWLYLGLILTAAEMSPKDSRGTFRIHARSMQRMIRGKVKGELALSMLQELQLLTYEKIDPLIELNRKELNRIEKNKIAYAQKIPKPKKTKQPKQSEFTDADASVQDEPNIGQKLVGVYCAAWKSRYKSNPPMLKHHPKILKDLGLQNGFERTKNLLEAYLRMNERFYLQKRHDLGTFLNNLTSVAHFIETGRVITGQDLRNVDRAIANKNTLDALENGEI